MEALAAAVRRAQQPPSQHGMTTMGLARARQLLHRQEFPSLTIDRMVSFLSWDSIDKDGSSWGASAKFRQPCMAGAAILARAGPARSLGARMLLGVEPDRPEICNSPATATPNQLGDH